MNAFVLYFLCLVFVCSSGLAGAAANGDRPVGLVFAAFVNAFFAAVFWEKK